MLQGKKRMRKKTYEKHCRRIRKTGVKIRHVSSISLGNCNNHSSAPTAGEYCRFTKSIQLDESLLYYQKFAFLLHEEGHYKCHAKGCHCFVSLGIANRAKQEQHAWEYALQELLRTKCSPSLFYTMAQMVATFNHSDNYIDSYYKKAARAIMRKNIWKECRKAVGGKLWKLLKRYDNHLNAWKKMRKIEKK